MVCVISFVFSLFVLSLFVLSRFVLPQPSASADNTNLCLNNSSYPTRTEFSNCFP